MVWGVNKKQVLEAITPTMIREAARVVVSVDREEARKWAELMTTEGSNPVG